jgi:hypothetical protein
MVVRRPFLSYSNADRSFVERVAAGLTAHGLMAIFDHWWLRSASADDLEGSKLELQMGINHADAFVYFDSVPTRKSTYVKYECDWAMWRTCSDAPHLHMVCVLMDDPNAQVPHWFQTAIDVTAGAKNLDAVIADLIAALGGEPDVGSSPEVCACRQLALASDFARLRAELRNSNETARRDAAILLACLDDDLDPASLAPAVQELENGLSTVGVERVIFAFGKLQAKAAPAINGIARFAESDADPHTRARAIRVLGRIGPCKETISSLIRIATRPTNVRKAALTELGNMGSAAAAAVPALVKLSEAADRHLRLVALAALGNIGICNCEVLVAVLKALAETGRQGISPSQMHHNAMSIMNQLAPEGSQLAHALLPARSQSPRFAEWFREQFPEADAAICDNASNDHLEQDLLSCARQILVGCQLSGANPDFSP